MPRASELSANDAVPFASAVVPMVVSPSANVTVPVGAAEEDMTIAENVTGDPKLTLEALEVSLVVVVRKPVPRPLLQAVILAVMPIASKTRS